MDEDAISEEAIGRTLRRSASALADAGVPFMLGGSLATWVRGGPLTRNDVDLLLPPEHADAAVAALEATGMRGEEVPETWLRKVWDGEVMVDLITAPKGQGEVTEAAVAAAERRSVLALSMRVASLESVLASKLLAINEQRLELGPPLAIARAVREQVDWEAVREATAASPFARAFFVLLEGLEIIGPQEADRG